MIILYDYYELNNIVYAQKVFAIIIYLEIKMYLLRTYASYVHK